MLSRHVSRLRVESERMNMNSEDTYMRRTKLSFSISFAVIGVPKCSTWLFDTNESLDKASVAVFDHCSASQAEISIKPCERN